MDESLPAPSASDEPAPPQDEKSRTTSRRLRVPTSLIVTVALALITVWVAPAFTRQWEDRKQARELQAALAEEISLSTARLTTLLDAKDPIDLGEPGFDWFGERSRPPTEAELSAAVDRWRLEHTRIGARLRVYFSSELQALWHDFGLASESAVSLVSSGRPLLVNLRWLLDLERDMGGHGVLTRFVQSVEQPGNETPVVPDNYPAPPDTRPADPLLVTQIPTALTDIAAGIVHRLMAANPEAFSTTRGDLLRDLLP